ncbi:uncharacterized protein LOC141913160 [Tubulanus polymorphus]|uniref:uncharacterized protein LOC141913160 n=1 Tax=Tubulanus polymorphus TaxID=672921 RepID=UPI003DA67F9F
MEVHYLWIILVYLLVEYVPLGLSIMCYECISTENPGCAFPFNPWKYLPTICHSSVEKCAVQIEYPSRGNRWIMATARGCYPPGSVQGLNTTDGCRVFTHGAYTATYCFCSYDHCNHAVRTLNSVYLIATLVSIAIAFTRWRS